MKKTLEMKKTIELIKQNTYEKKNKKNTNKSLITTKEKQLIKEEPIQGMDKFGERPETKVTGTRPCSFCSNPNCSSLHKSPALESTCNNCGKKDIMQGHADDRD